MRISALSSAGLLSICMCFGAPVRSAGLADCPENYDVAGAMDYLDAKYATSIHGMESNHLNADVENLIRGQSVEYPGGDITYLLQRVPNHHRALAALVRLAIRDRTDRPRGSDPYTVRCWLQRATIFSPDDGTPFLMYGIYLARNNLTQEAAKQLDQAAKLLPDNADVAYNLGLVHFEMKDYEGARKFAKSAYALGFPLMGLRRKLESAGFPLD